MVTNMLLLVLSLSGASSTCDLTPGLFISAPKSMEVLSGSCVRIPCTFRLLNEHEFHSSTASFGVWIKKDSRFRLHPGNVIFNSSWTVEKNYPVQISRNLGQKNCTTLFLNVTSDSTEKYFFRIENGEFKATASCDSIKITVKDSPPSPRIQISPQQLKEKESVTITCSALTPCPHSPPKLTWNLQHVENKMDENPDRTLTTKIQQIITVSDQHDGFNISCSAAYPVDKGRIKTAQTNITLSVSYAPKSTSASISPSGSLWIGIWVNLTCSSRAKPVSNFSWFKTSTHGPIRVSEGDVYSFNLTNDTRGDYYCEATNNLGKQKSSVIHVNIEVSGSSLTVAIIGGIIGLIVLICAAVAVWRLKSKHVTSGHPQTEDPGSTTAKEDIHYGQINFSDNRLEPYYDSVQDARGQQQETVYSHVKMSKTDHSSDIYAQVKK